MLLRGAAAAAAVALVGAGSVAAAGEAGARVVGPDVSSHNHDNRATLNWRVIRNVGGGKFAFVKATEGRDYVNPRYASDWASMRRNGVLRSAYHYARPSGRTKSQIIADATAEADFFVRHAGTFEGPDILPPVLDLESSGSLAPRQMWWWTQAWLDRTEALTGRTPILYTYVNFWHQNMKNSRAFTAYPLWLASYGVSRPGTVGGWKRYTFWQYTSHGRMAGAGLPVDLSVYRGSITQLRKMTTNRSSKPATSRTLESPRTPPGSKPSPPALDPETSRPAQSSKESTANTTLTYTTRVPPGAPEAQSPSWANIFGEKGIHEIVSH
jgi:lysozyme